MGYRKLISIGLTAALALSLTACAGEEEPQDQEGVAGVAVQVQQVTRDTIATENNVSGKVVADSTTSVYVSVSAKCTAVYVENGDLVQAGEKLCTLDLASTLASYNSANISYQSAQQSYQDQQAVFDSQIALYEKTVSDLEALFEIGAASQLEIDQAKLQLESAIATRNSTLSQLEAGMQSYKSSVEQLSTVLENVDSGGNVIAPAPGTVTDLAVEENSFTSAGMPVAVIDGVDQMKVSVSVSEALVPKLAVGDEVDVSVSAVSQSFTGTIRSVERSANQQTMLYTVTISVPAEVSGLLSGMFADVTFRTDVSQQAVVVPTQAILTSGATQYVFVVEEDTAKYVPVTAGLTGNGVTEITVGLEGGELLVVVGQAYLSDGDLVRVVSGEA